MRSTEIWEVIGDKGFELLLAFIAFLGTNTGLHAFRRFAKKRIEAKARKRVYEAGLNTLEAYRLCSSLIGPTNIERVLLFKASNSGSAGEPLETYHIEIIQAASTSKEKEAYYLDRFEYFRPDVQYREMLTALANPLTADFLDFYPQGMPEGRLKRIYTDEGVVFARVFLVRVEGNNNIFFGSAAIYGESGKSFTDKDALEVELLVDKLKKLTL